MGKIFTAWMIKRGNSFALHDCTNLTKRCVSVAIHASKECADRAISEIYDPTNIFSVEVEIKERPKVRKRRK